jgi:hypothetical protein
LTKEGEKRVLRDGRHLSFVHIWMGRLPLQGKKLSSRDFGYSKGDPDDFRTPTE